MKILLRIDNQGSRHGFPNVEELPHGDQTGDRPVSITGAGSLAGDENMATTC